MQLVSVTGVIAAGFDCLPWSPRAVHGPQRFEPGRGLPAVLEPGLPASVRGAYSVTMGYNYGY